MKNYNYSFQIDNSFEYYENNIYLYRCFDSKAPYWQKGPSKQDIPNTKIGVLKERRDLICYELD